MAMQIHQTVPLAIAALIGAGGVGFAVREHKQALETTTHEQAIAAATISQLEQRVKELSDRLNQQAAEKERPAPVRVRRAPAIKAALVRRPADDPRWQRVESRLADHEQRIAGTKQDVENTRTELEDKLSSTKDELGGSIARTHDELVVLQKRGERNYSEFTLDKSKDFRKVGTVSLGLRKADTKHQRYNLELIVDDVKLEKKNVSLYEPVYLTLADRPQPMEVVVNKISKDEVRGYVSQPKYKKSELVGEVEVRNKLPEPQR
jgi:DNA repair exonuclease SbcCD ATPase subunit